MALPQETTTIEQFIESGKGITISYFNLSFSDMMSNGTWISVLNVVSDYLAELKSASVIVELTQEQYQTYMYKPKLLCYDVYGNPELYFVILLLNDIADVKEFNKDKVRMLRKDYMSNLLSYIYNAERDAISQYNDKENA